MPAEQTKSCTKLRCLCRNPLIDELLTFEQARSVLQRPQSSRRRNLASCFKKEVIEVPNEAFQKAEKRHKKTHKSCK